ncbi:hypothetical protein GCM10023063_15860 [Arthrobacter methylotrophus]|uniref:Uncharacterized protein n=1 Tax=Arthrobacter methylotrophus TaxID=121291 RepID=A0ABV5UNB3_9MICC
MTVIIDFPRQAKPQAVAVHVISDAVLQELLRKAVVAYRAGEARVAGSLGHRHHLAVSLALLDAIQIVMDACGLAQELERCMGTGITDIRTLTRIVRDFDGPRSA